MKYCKNFLVFLVDEILMVLFFFFLYCFLFAKYTEISFLQNIINLNSV